MRSDAISTIRTMPARRGLLTRLVRHRVWSPLNDAAHWNRLISAVNPLWSVNAVQARVVRVVDEARAVRSLWLKPNARFRGFRPGQHVLLDLDVDGVRQARCFSLSHAPRADGLLRLTIKCKQDGPVSHAAHALRVGQIVRLSQAQGSFAPRNTSSKLLLMSAGSGITPMLSLLHGFAAQTPARDVVMLHVCRSSVDMIASTELRDLKDQLPGLRVLLHTTEASGRLDPGQIADAIPDWAEREALLCGPDEFMRGVEAMYAQAGRLDQLSSESFGRRAADIDADAPSHAVVAANSEQVFTALSGQSLLEAAEAAGLTPRFGCRRGICRTCQCVKRSGTVVNTLTGQVSGPGEELIQLCISTPHSAVELAL